jgi:hypothetical protein
VLHLSCNPLVQLPEAIGSLRALEELHCWSCDIESLSDDFFSDSQLKLVGSPSLSNLRTLDLHGNHLTILPSSWCSALKGLTALDLSSNCFQYLPASIECMSNLIHLNLRRNRLLLIPPTLARLRKYLQSFYISQNPLCTPPSTFRGATLAYYHGLLPGEYYDLWFLRSISQCLASKRWDSIEMEAIGTSISPELLRRHIGKAILDSNSAPAAQTRSAIRLNTTFYNACNPVEMKLLLLHSHDRKVVLASLEELGSTCKFTRPITLALL